MDFNPLVRLRWRLSGAWLWPSFVVLTLADGLIVHALPLSGDVESFVGAWLLGAILSLIGIALLGGVAGRVVRRASPDMPKSVARNYGGSLVTFVITLALLAGGLAHHPKVAADRKALQEAVARAAAYIGDRAPSAFQANLREMVTIQVVPQISYRSCVPDTTGIRQYCVVVNITKPFGTGVYYSGSESNATLDQGVN